MSRPKGSKNKVKRITMADEPKLEETKSEVVPEEKAKDTPRTPKSGVTVAIDEEADVLDSYGGDCPNCLNHNKKKQLNPNGTCSVCNFDKSKLYGAF
jgi:hypothetical protein